ncbi:MAG: hypothetical protein AAGA15_00365 [Pseudomonadota bacterium]
MMSNRRTTGEMISTLCFFGVGLWLFGQAALATEWPRAALLATCGVFCLAGAARHLIARLFQRSASPRMSGPQAPNPSEPETGYKKAGDGETHPDAR